MKGFYFIIIFAILLSSCKNHKYETTFQCGVKTITNFGRPTNPKLDINLKKIVEVQGFDEDKNPDTSLFYYAKSILVDENENIFVIDDSSTKIYKFDSSGNFIKSFISKGTGPGEMEDFGEIFILDNLLYVTNNYQNHQFDLDGNYISSEKIDKMGLKVDAINDSIIFIRSVILETKEGNLNDSYFIQDFCTTNTKFNIKKQFFQSKHTFNQILYDDTDDGFFTSKLIVPMNSDILIGERSKEDYLISLYDLEANVLYNFSLEKSKMLYTDSENEFIEENFLNISHGNKSNLFLLHNSKPKYSHIHYDKLSDTVWIENCMKLEDESITFDLFREGIYLNSFKFSLDESFFYPLRMDSYFMIENGKLYFNNTEDNKIVIFDIDYQNI